MKQISLSQGQCALIDDEDFARISAHRWYALWVPGSRSFVAVRAVSKNEGGRRGLVYMAREIMQATPSAQVDHCDHNTLNNQRSNLRVCTPSQNSCNRRARPNNTSGFKGVCRTNSGRWQAQITIKRKQKHLGVFDSPEAAHEAYVVAAQQLHGEFANTEGV